jgi:hypothetical protein
MNGVPCARFLGGLFVVCATPKTYILLAVAHRHALVTFLGEPGLAAPPYKMECRRPTGRTRSKQPSAKPCERLTPNAHIFKESLSHDR